MKKMLSFLTLAAILTGAMSCNKNAVTPEVKQPEGLMNGSLTITIGMDDEATKAALSEMKDYQINQVQVFVFDANNRLETDRFVDGLSEDTSYSLTINTKTGEKTVYALVNQPRKNFTPGSAGKTLTDFEAELSDLSENNNTNLAMSGKNTISVTDVNNNGTIGAPQTMNIYVKRLAARVQLDAVKVDFRDNSLKDASFTVQEIYLKNVVGKSPIGVQGLTGTAKAAVLPSVLPDEQHAATANWYNKMTKEAGSPLCIDDVYSQNCTVAGAATAQNRVLYAYPNKTVGDSNAATFSQRHTRLVIKAHVTKTAVNVDKDTYYVLDLPVLVANTVYEIQNVNITMLGKDNDDNDDDIDVGKITPTITVDPWTDTVHLNYEF